MYGLRKGAGLFVTGLLLCSVGHSQTPEIVPPGPENVEGLESPGFGTEGLHILRFTVKEDGSTDDVEVVGGFTNRQARQFLVGMARGWTFEPGTVNGRPDTFYNQEYVVRNFLVEEAALSPQTQKKLEEVGELMAEGDHDKALREINRLINRNLVTTLDYTVAHEILTNIYLDAQQLFEALEASRIATMSRVNSQGNVEFLLPIEMLETALRKRFMLAGAVHQNAEAVRTFDILEQAFEIAQDDPIREQAQEFQATLNSPEPIALLAKIVDDQWSYPAARRIFTVTDVDGRLNRINVRCELGNVELKYEEGVDWTLPDTLGACTLDFIGRDGTTFTVYEFVE